MTTTATAAKAALDRLRAEAQEIGAQYTRERAAVATTREKKVVPMVIALTDAGRPQREIADLLEVSHQLVGQIQQANGRVRPRRKKPTEGP